jgi:hypothetical protein
MRQGKEMDTKFVILLVISALLVAAIYSSSSPFHVFVEGLIDGSITCSPQGGGKTYCCASVYEGGTVSTTYCTTCDDTNPPSNCTEREKPRTVVNPGKVLSDVLQGWVSENPTTGQQLDRDVGPRGDFRELPENNITSSEGVGPNAGGFYEQPESSDND